MRRIPPAVLIVAALAIVVVGGVATIVFAVAQSHCQGTFQGPAGQLLPAHLAGACRTQTTGVQVSFGAVALGGVLFVLGALAATPRFRRGRP